MNKQPEALRLADVLQHLPHHRLGYLQDQAATELRRLHEVNTELIFALKYISAQTHIGHIQDTASSAIAKATGEQA